MANEWLRLWHDMPNDPKWRTIARLSGQPVSLVQSVYLHLLVDASRSVTRGHVTVTAEDLASALDVTEDAIQPILTAMDGRVIADGYLSGWEKRQPKREDAGDEITGAKSAAQRKKEQRDRQRQTEIGAMSRQSHDESREVTLDKDKEEDKEEEKKEKIPRASRTASKSRKTSIPDGFGLSASVIAWAERDGHTNLQTRLDHFIGAAKAKGYLYVDWDQALQNAIREDWAKLNGHAAVNGHPHLNRQEALEASNQAIAERALRNSA